MKRSDLPMLPTPEVDAEYPHQDQFRLYKLIWQRFLACQMEVALLNVVTVDIGAKNYTFRAVGTTMKFPGFTVLYTEGTDNGQANEKDDEKEQQLPKLTVDEILRLLNSSPSSISPSRLRDTLRRPS